VALIKVSKWISGLQGGAAVGDFPGGAAVCGIPGGAAAGGIPGSSKDAFCVVSVIQGCITRLSTWEVHADFIAAASETILQSYTASRRMIQHRPLFAEHFGRQVFCYQDDMR
jgi:hypothetical protein